MLRETFSYISKQKWHKDLVNELNEILLQHPLNINDDTCPDGVSYHIVDIYIEELAKFGETLKPNKSVRLIEPFFKLMAISKKY
jgi:hypothetical protein